MHKFKGEKILPSSVSVRNFSFSFFKFLHAFLEIKTKFLEVYDILLYFFLSLQLQRAWEKILPSSVTVVWEIFPFPYARWSCRLKTIYFYFTSKTFCSGLCKGLNSMPDMDRVLARTINEVIPLIRMRVTCQTWTECWPEPLMR